MQELEFYGDLHQNSKAKQFIEYLLQNKVANVKPKLK